MTFSAKLNQLDPKFGPFTSIALFRSAEPPLSLTSFVIDGVGACVYKPSEGANVPDNGFTIFKPDSVALEENGRGYLNTSYSTKVASTPIGTGSSWVTLITVPGPSADAGIVTVGYHLFGKYSTTASLVARGTVTVQRLSGVNSTLDTSISLYSARVQMSLQSGNILLQAQQHATENWAFSGEYSVRVDL